MKETAYWTPARIRNRKGCPAARHAILVREGEEPLGLLFKLPRREYSRVREDAMTMSPVALVAALVLVMGLVLPHHVVFAGDRPQPRGGTIVAGPVVPRPPVRPFVHPFGFHPFFPRRHFVPFGVAAPPIIVSAPPTVLYTPSSVVYVQPLPVMTLTPPPPPPTPSVIEYPNGRYELRGDGITTPHTWAWIPKPPPPPPASPETHLTVPPAAPSNAPADPPSTDQRTSGPRVELYRWTDGGGVTTWTDRLDKVPERYRAQAQRVL